ncbi:hypothetical protein HK096_008952, partial [Nowakowskiella sp. JEL0078]
MKSPDNEFISPPAPQQNSVPSFPQINTSIVPSSAASQTLQSPPGYAPVSTEVYYAQQPTGFSQIPNQPYSPYAQTGYTQPGYAQPGYAPYNAQPVDPKLQGVYPPMNYAVTGQQIQVTLAEHTSSLQAGFWPGCVCSCFFGPLGLLTLFFFQPPLVAPGGDMRPAIYAKAKQAGVFYGTASGIGAQAILWLILVIVSLTSVYSYSYGGYTYTYRYYSSSFIYYIVITVFWLLVSAGAFYFGKKRSEELKK